MYFAQESKISYFTVSNVLPFENKSLSLNNACTWFSSFLNNHLCVSVFTPKLCRSWKYYKYTCIYYLDLFFCLESCLWWSDHNSGFTTKFKAIHLLIYIQLHIQSMWDMSLGCSIAELAANQHFAFFNSFHCQLCEPIKEKRNLSNQKSQTHNSKLLTMCFFFLM